MSETTGPISIYFCRSVSLVIFYQDCSSHLDSSKKKMAARGRSLFSLSIYIENFKNLLVRNHWSDFNITRQECFFFNLLPRLFKPLGFVKKHGRQGGGAYFSLYIYIGKFKNLHVRNHKTDFYITWQKCSLVILYQDCSSRHDLSKNMAARGRGLFSLCIYIENFNDDLVRNHWTDFNITLQK